MDPQEWIITKQIEWAKNKGIMLIPGQGNQGNLTYAPTIEENLFRPLSPEGKVELEEGDGGELICDELHPAKIQAVHSSAALGVNVFDYWRGYQDLSIIASCCRLARRGRKLSGEIHFEFKAPIDERFRFPPNLDVVILLPKSHRYKCFAIECKFSEPYSGRRHGGLDPNYFDNQEVWNGLKNTRSLAEELSPNDNRFEFLYAAQLVKHILGLSRKFGRTRFRLLYLYYDAPQANGCRHTVEIEEFAEIVGGDGIAFHYLTYQELISRLARYRDVHTDYIKYLTERYL